MDDRAKAKGDADGMEIADRFRPGDGRFKQPKRLLVLSHMHERHSLVQLGLGQQALVWKLASQLQEPTAGVELITLPPGVIEQSNEGRVQQSQTVGGAKEGEDVDEWLQAANPL